MEMKHVINYHGKCYIGTLRDYFTLISVNPHVCYLQEATVEEIQEYAEKQGFNQPKEKN